MNNFSNLLIKSLAILLLLGWYWYWQVTEKVADTEKPKTKKPSLQTIMEAMSFRLVWVFIFLQFFGLKIFPMANNLLLQILGLILLIGGISVGVSGRKILGTNWTHAAEYQIKKDHELITKGIYRYIRHPIYAGLIIMITGTELIIQSHLFIAFFIASLFVAFIQSKREEGILREYFGEKYIAYMKQTRMFFPFIF